MKLRLFPALLFFGIFFFLPLARILTLSLDPNSILSLSGSFYPRLLIVLRFTFFQAIASTLLTLIVGLPLAFLFVRYDFPLKSQFRTLTAIPFMLPTVVVAAGFNALLGPRGWLNLGLMGLLSFEQPPVTFVGTLWAILAAHVFYNATIVIRIVGNAWSQLDPCLAQAARSLGASPARVLWNVTLPLLRPSILAAGLLVFLFDFTSYGVILLLGGPKFSTLEVEIYVQALQMLNLPAASLLSAVQLLCTLAFSVLYSRYVARIAAPVKPVEQTTRRPKTLLETSFLLIFSSFILLFFALPLLALPLRSLSHLEADRGQRAQVGPALTADYYTELFVNRRGSIFYVPPFEAVRNSLVYAGLTVVLSLLLGFPAGVALSRPGRLEKWIDPFLMLPLGASAVTLGLGYILTFNRLFIPFSSSPILLSPLVIPLAHTTIALPFVIRNLQSALLTIPQRYREAAAVLGANPWQTWLNVDWPIISRAVVSAGAFAFTVSLGEFGAASLLVRPEYPTLPTAIYRFLSQPGGLNYGQAMAMATMLMVVTGLCIWVIERERVAGEF
jgi:thiamine transport system permease protein